MSKTISFVLGLIGGIFGFFAALVTLIFGGIGSALGGEGASAVIGLGWLAVLFSGTGIIGAVFVKSKTKFGGWMMIISAIGGIISVSVVYLLPGLLLLLGGILGLKKENKK